MVRRETYGTTGPRMRVRFFGGWEYTENDLRSRAPAFVGYEKGVPMGGDLRLASEGKTAPTFMIYALRDPIGANLDRIQITKGRMDAAGKLHEKVYDVAVSDGRKIENGRCKTPVGNTVDIEAGRIPLVPRSWSQSGPIPISMPRNPPFTMRACWRFPRRGGSSMTGFVSGPRFPKKRS